jgi:hypothetical protein
MISFKTFLKETPSIDDTDKQTVSAYASSLQDHIQSLDHSKHDNIGDECKVCHNSDGSKYYYHLKDGNVHEFSHITKDHVHKSTYKGSEGNVNYIHKFMKYHAKKHGHVKAYKTNTKGAISLWKGLIKSKPMNKSFHKIDNHNNTQEPIHHKNIDSKEHEIWGNDKDHVHLEMRHKND